MFEENNKNDKVAGLRFGEFLENVGTFFRVKRRLIVVSFCIHSF